MTLHMRRASATGHQARPSGESGGGWDALLVAGVGRVRGGPTGAEPRRGCCLEWHPLLFRLL